MNAFQNMGYAIGNGFSSLGHAMYDHKGGIGRVVVAGVIAATAGLALARTYSNEGKDELLLDRLTNSQQSTNVRFIDANDRLNDHVNNTTDAHGFTKQLANLEGSLNDSLAGARSELTEQIAGVQTNLDGYVVEIDGVRYELNVLSDAVKTNAGSIGINAESIETLAREQRMHRQGHSPSIVVYTGSSGSGDDGSNTSGENAPPPAGKVPAVPPEQPSNPGVPDAPDEEPATAP